MRSNIRDMKANDRTFIKAIVLRNRRRNLGEVALPEDPREVFDLVWCKRLQQRYQL